VTIIGIGERQHQDEVFVIGDHGIPNVGVHQLPGPLQLLTGEVGAIL
jgi:hypothetical protein